MERYSEMTTLELDGTRVRRGWSIQKRLAVWAIGSAVGAAILALPDANNRVFSLSETHGPSPVDLVGLVIVVAAWVPIAAVLWLRRKSLTGAGAWTAFVLAAVGAAMLVVTIGFDLGPIYLAAVGLLLAAQLLALRVIARKGDGR